MLETDLTKIEIKIMKVIWNSPEKLHLKTVQEKVNETFGADWKPQTISTYLAHLIRKGYLSMERNGKVFLYTAEISEKEFFENEIKNLFEYFSEYNLIDFLQAYPDETYSQEMLEQMKNMLQE